MRNTKQKEAIIAAVNNTKTHPTADEIYSALKPEHEKLSLGTVYRNLNKFSENGLIKKISVPGLGDRFDFNTSDHEHFICIDCGKVFDAKLSGSLTSMVTSQDIEVTHYALMLYGHCSECKTNTVKQSTVH